MDRTAADAVEERRKWIEAWNSTMLDIWHDRIRKLRVRDTGALFDSLQKFSIKTDPDGKFLELEIKHEFLEYGLWNDLGVGRGVDIGNTHKRDQDGWQNPRKRRKWESRKYYASTMRLKEFMAESLGEEFIGMVADLDADTLRRNSNYYRRKGLS